MLKIRKIRRLIKGTIAEWQKQDVSLLASALAYSTVFSIAPLMILVIMILEAIFDEAMATEQIVTQLTNLMGTEAAKLVATAITNLQMQTGQGTVQLIFNLGFFAFGATSVFSQIQNSLNRIWDVQPVPKRRILQFLRKRLLSFAMILVIVFLLLASSIATTTLAAIVATLNQWVPGLGNLWQILQWLVSFGIVFAVFAAIYTILPDIEIHWRDTLIGAMITAILFLFGQALFGIFLNQVNIGSAYGVAGSFLIVISWIFYAAQILFSGAAFTKVYARQRGTPITPSEFAVSTSDPDQGYIQSPFKMQ
ncbi:YihY/virulence factor BrkB family protein [Leptolyngbya sp. GB1-A1]|uniref:YihY/virulence factor BrkB family protein n=1 Tax=Leptolyngbya sp. GB1-A1 TaxID=2933908 RepID=UPI003296D943